jgi:hypothetical protein
VYRVKLRWLYNTYASHERVRNGTKENSTKERLSYYNDSAQTPFVHLSGAIQPIRPNSRPHVVPTPPDDEPPATQVPLVQT